MLFVRFYLDDLWRLWNLHQIELLRGIYSFHGKQNLFCRVLCFVRRDELLDG